MHLAAGHGQPGGHGWDSDHGSIPIQFISPDQYQYLLVGSLYFVPPVPRVVWCRAAAQ